jgi:ketosteroid isomerase-like protein
VAQAQTINEQLRELWQRWTEAETSADVSALDVLATDDFTLVGPVGFVLDKQQWLDRYRAGALSIGSLSFETAQTRIYGDVAVTVGRYMQAGEYRGASVDGEFRATVIAFRDGSRWRLAGMHLSVIGGPPPFAPNVD